MLFVYELCDLNVILILIVGISDYDKILFVNLILGENILIEILIIFILFKDVS